MKIRLRLSRRELDELDSFLDCLLANWGHTPMDIYFRGLDPLTLARVHERVIWMMEEVFKGDHMRRNEFEGRKRLPLEEHA